MKSAKPRSRRTIGRRRSRKRSQPLAGAREFLRQTFYYLKGEQLLKISTRLLLEAA